MSMVGQTVQGIVEHVSEEAAQRKAVPDFFGEYGAGVTSAQRAKTVALTYAYLWKQLGGSLTP